ncbi:ligand-binding sensor domain-containing protein [Marinicella litoralis]|uniref:ligand-binding sensor domain-containing protein n=1 Tax=Marinicella litoralis TaxID=644220 RepID=UPI000BFF13B3|nr:ligand-binding sensor domain-containing diguanylate cyclase [Marinicella litoralis]
MPFANLSIADGLEDMVIFDIEQDDHGFLWMTTRTGISRFDGNQFWTFNRSNGLPHNLVRDLLKAKNGKLWAASEAGLAWFDGYEFKSISEEYWPSNVSARALQEAADGTIWVATYGMGIVQIDPSGNPKIINQFNSSTGFPSDRFRSLMIDVDGHIWAGDSKRVIRINNDGYEAIEWKAEASEIRTIFQHENKQIWVGTRNGVAVFDGTAFVPLDFDVDLSNQTINSFTVDHQQHIWVSSRDYGAYEFNQDRQLVKHLNMSNGLPDNSVNSMYQDSENNIWFGTYGGGIARLSAANVTNWKAQNAMPNPNVYAIIQDNNGCIWIGTNGDGVSLLCEGELTHITTKQGLSHNKVLTAVLDDEGDPWFGTLQGITYQKNNQFHQLHISEGLTGPVVYHIIKDLDDSLWIGTNNGLNHYQDGKFTSYFTEDGLPDNRINRIFQSKNGDIWLASSNGLSLFKDGQFTNWSTSDGLAANFINDIYEDGKGVLWLATNNGLSLFDGTSFTTWTTEDGLPHNNATSILQGENNDIWIGTSRGVAIFDGSNFTVITSREGLVFDLVNRGAGFRDDQGNLWFGTAKGISRFDANFKPGSSTPPPVHIISVRNEMDALDLNTKIRIQQQDSSLTLSFTAISFQRAPDISYRYRLAVNEDTPWRETRLNEIQINSLAAGNYRFQVTARIGNGAWNSNPAEFNFEVTPPFWQTPWFILLLIAGVVIFLLYRNWRNKQHALKLENIVFDRTKQLEELNQGLDWLANHDSLTRLSNRNHVQNLLNEFSYASSSPFAVIAIDLDYFKNVNDQYGHDFGDQVLKRFSKMLSDLIEENQTAARWGGEEFIIICPQIKLTQLKILSLSIIQQCRHLIIPNHLSETVDVTCSVGFAYIPGFNPEYKLVTQMEKTIQLADQALYAAKHNGRDQLYGYIIKQPAKTIQLKTYLSDIQDAIDKQWIEAVKE